MEKLNQYRIKTVLQVNLCFSVVAIILVIIFCPYHRILPSILAYFLCECALYFMNHRNVNRTVLSVLVVLTQNILLIPSLFFSGNNYANGLSYTMFFLIIMLGFLFKGSVMLIFIAVELTIFAFCLRNMYYLDIKPLTVENQSVYNTALLIMYLIFCTMVCFYLWKQQKYYRKEVEIIENNQKLEQKSIEVKSRFLSNMTSEVRIPMNAMIGVTQIMLQDDIDKNIKYDIGTIRNAAEDLLGIIDDVLAYSQLDMGKVELHEEEFDLGELVSSTCDIIANAIGDKKIELEVSMEHHIPKQIYGPREEIKRVLLYLFFSSLTYLTEGKILFEIAFESHNNKDGTLQLRIGDNGKGLTKIDLYSLLGTYRNYDTKQNSNLKGIGLKYSICDEMVQLMNGTFLVESIEHIGILTSIGIPVRIVDASPVIQIQNVKSLKILVYLETDAEKKMWDRVFEPLMIHVNYVRNKESFDTMILMMKYDFIFMGYAAYEDLSDVLESYECESYTYILGKSTSIMGDFGSCKLIKHPLSCLNISMVLNGEWQENRYKSKVGTENFTARQARILVVDDNSVNLKVAKGIFKKYEIDIDIADSGRKALKMIENTYYDMVFLDQMMPEMDGIDTLKLIRDSKEHDCSNLPIIALTANKGSEIRAQLAHAGFQDFIAKPMKTRYLEEILRKFLPENLIETRIENTDLKNHSKEQISGLVVTTPTKELQVEKALVNFKQDREEYFEWLNRFYQEGNEYINTLPKAFHEADYTLLINQFHIIKSQSAMIGLPYISECFRLLEMAGKRRDYSYMENNLDSFLREYHMALAEVKEYLIQNHRWSSMNSEFLPQNENQYHRVEIVHGSFGTSGQPDALNGKLEDELSMDKDTILRREYLNQMKQALSVMKLGEFEEILIDALKNCNDDKEWKQNLQKIANAFDNLEIKKMQQLINQALVS